MCESGEESCDVGFWTFLGSLDDTRVCSGCLLIGFSFASSFLGDEEVDVRTSLRDLRVTLGLLLSKVDSSFQPFSKSLWLRQVGWSGRLILNFPERPRWYFRDCFV